VGACGIAILCQDGNGYGTLRGLASGGWEAINAHEGSTIEFVKAAKALVA